MGLALPAAVFDAARTRLETARDRLAAALEAQGFAVLPAAGSYFLAVDLPESGVKLDEVTFCERAVREFGVAAIPFSAFYAGDAMTGLVRLCFAKLDATLDTGAGRLGQARREFAAGN